MIRSPFIIFLHPLPTSHRNHRNLLIIKPHVAL